MTSAVSSGSEAKNESEGSGSGRTPRLPGQLLVVDDNEMNRDMLSRRLARKGYDVKVAADGREALDMLASGDFDLVLLDIMMPGISGLEVLAKVREEKSRADLPIIMATAKTESADVVEALKLGANDYVTKPLDFQVVLARVEAQLGLKLATEKIRALARELEVRNQFIRKIFGRYLSDDIVTNLLETPAGLSLGGAKREVTILMCDIRGFSMLSAQLQPDQVVAVVNNFLSVMTDVILEFGGTIDEFIGDAILVLFGAPIDRPDHAEAAVACAIRMQDGIRQVNARNLSQGLPVIEMGVGINTGEVVVGNIGSEKRAKYGVVGANVNLAARIESYTVGGQVLISHNTYQAAAAVIEVGENMEVNPKGAESPFLVHDVLAIRGRHNLEISKPQVVLLELANPIAAQYTIMHDKDAGGVSCDAQVTHLSENHLQLLTAEPALAVMSNLKLVLHPDETSPDTLTLFAKVVSVTGGQPLLRFTSASDATIAAIKNLIS